MNVVYMGMMRGESDMIFFSIIYNFFFSVIIKICSNCNLWRMIYDIIFYTINLRIKS